MINDDTIKLLRECNAGIKMGVISIDDVLSGAKNYALRALLEEAKKKHETLGDETHALLNKYHDEDKDVSSILKAMSWLKVNVKLLQHPQDEEVADLMIDGCNMGVKSLSRYINQYQGADQASRDMANRVIQIEEQLMVDLRAYL